MEGNANDGDILVLIGLRIGLRNLWKRFGWMIWFGRVNKVFTRLFVKNGFTWNFAIVTLRLHG
jgi:hypothetical protein